MIYVSVDVDEQWYKAGTRGQQWVSMVWDDGSSPPSEKTTNSSSSAAAGESGDASGKGKPAPKPRRTGSDGSTGSGRDSGAEDAAPALYNGEDFLLGGEPDIDESLSHSDTSGEAYLRPFSRVHLASKLNIIAAPTLCVYHLGTGTMLDWNVRMTKLRPDRERATWERWASGEKTAGATIAGESTCCLGRKGLTAADALRGAFFVQTHSSSGQGR